MARSFAKLMFWFQHEMEFIHGLVLLYFSHVNFCNFFGNLCVHFSAPALKLCHTYKLKELGKRGALEEPGWLTQRCIDFEPWQGSHRSDYMLCHCPLAVGNPISLSWGSIHTKGWNKFCRWWYTAKTSCILNLNQDNMLRKAKQGTGN